MKKGFGSLMWLLALFAVMNFPADAVAGFLLRTGIVDDGTLSDEERLEDLPEEHLENAYVGARMGGDCRTLEGDVLITMIMVDDSSGAWDAESYEQWKAEQEKYLGKLVRDSRRYGADVRLSMQYMACEIEGSVSLADHDDWTKAALDAVGILSDDSSNVYLKEKYGVDEAPIMFCVNYSGRAFATQRNVADGAEYGYLFETDSDFRHEMLHLFGAEDFYYPDEVKHLGEEYFPDSVMLCTGENTVDPLTAYLIGWTDAPSEEAVKFLAATDHLTAEYISEVNKKQSFTGNGTREYDNGTYTGELLAGVPNGYGRIVWDSGDTYEGEWVNGKCNGEGTYKSADGDYYTGNWVDGKREGRGVYIFFDGTCYDGEWLADDYNGHGKITYASGSTYEGEWVDGEQDGYGVYIEYDGDRYEGEWLDGCFSGYGELYYSSGDTYKGDFVNGERCGYGVYESDGFTLEGQWVNGEFQG